MLVHHYDLNAFEYLQLLLYNLIFSYFLQSLDSMYEICWTFHPFKCFRRSWLSCCICNWSQNQPVRQILMIIWIYLKRYCFCLHVQRINWYTVGHTQTTSSKTRSNWQTQSKIEHLMEIVKKELLILLKEGILIL